MLFADLVGSTADADGADPRTSGRRLRPYYACVRDEIESFGGTVEKFIGDAVVGVFGAPLSHEDDPTRAVQAAVAVVGALEALNEEDPELRLAVRVAVDTGEAVVTLGDLAERGEGTATGDVMNTVARLQPLAPTGGVVVGPRTFLATRGSFQYEAMDPVAQGEGADPDLECRRRSLEQERAPLAPLIGRARSPAAHDAVGQVRADNRPQIVTVIGAPGIGKSRWSGSCNRRWRPTGSSSRAVAGRTGRRPGSAPSGSRSSSSPASSRRIPPRPRGRS